MKIKDGLSRKGLVKSLKKLGIFRAKLDHDSIITLSALTIILLIAFTIRIFPLRWEIQTGSVHLSEFDPYFHYRFVGVL